MRKFLPPVESLIWLVGLIALAAFYPTEQIHFTICPLANAGFELCPGCGLGRSVSYFFHGEILKSINAHPLGIFAIIILTYRIITLSIKHYRYGKNY